MTPAAVVFRAELIGPGFTWTHQLDARDVWPWVARITGLDPVHGFRREFLPRTTDSTEATVSGRRGVWVFWNLHQGNIYEVKYLVHPRRPWIRRFITVTPEGDIQDLTHKEVLQWLADR